jgi:predicted nucleotidyltransferase
MDRARYAEVLRRLAANDVEFIVVGLMAGVLRGAPVMTADLDLVHRRSPDNVARLLTVLGELDAVYRHDARQLRPAESQLMSPGHQLLKTTHGDVDCLGTVANGLRYEDLLERAPELDLGDGLHVKVIDLATLIELKQAAGRPKDLAVLPVLRATLAEARRRA